ncbi:hypothetical protein ACWCYY_23915 [Kitasatospora sp. NPDC001664]
MTGRQAAAAVVTLVTAAVLALTACGPKAAHQGTDHGSGQSAGADNAQVQDMQQKLDAAESAAAEADADSTQAD